MFRKLLNKTIKFLTVIAIILSICALVWIGVDENKYLSLEHKENIKKISFIGSYSTNDNDHQIPLPNNYRLNLEGYNNVVITGKFSESIPKNKLLIMRIDNLKVRIFVNDELIYSFGDLDSKPSYVKSPGNVWDSFISPGIEANDEVRIELTNLYTNHVNTVFKTFLDNLHYGYEKELIVENINSRILNGFISIFIVSIGVVTFIFCLIFLKMKKPMIQVMIFSLLSIFSGIWFFIDFKVLGYFVPLPIFNNSLDILSIMLTANFLMIYFYSKLKSKCRDIFLYASGIWSINIILSTVMQFLGIFDYYNFSLVIEILSIISVIIIAISLIIELYSFKDKYTKSLVYSTIFICAGIIGDVVCNYFEIIPFVIWFKIGFLLFMIVQFIHLVKFIKELILENARIQVLEERQEQLEKDLAYQQLITESTKGFYESIYEFDITHNCAGNEETCKYFESIGLSKDASYDQYLEMIAENQIKLEFRQKYMEILSSINILKSYNEGRKNPRYDLMISSDNGKSYYWIRIMTCIFYWKYDNSIRVLAYCQNIDDEIKQTRALEEQAKRDSLTNLLNKATTDEVITKTISNANFTSSKYAFFIIDIDDFKIANDNFGHAFGDFVITRFAVELKSQFRNYDILGRIGGDEFVIFIPIPSEEWVEKKASNLVRVLNQEVSQGESLWKISVSIGIAISPEYGTSFEALYRNADKALYETKKRGKNGFTIYIP